MSVRYSDGVYIYLSTVLVFFHSMVCDGASESESEGKSGR